MSDKPKDAEWRDPEKAARLRDKACQQLMKMPPQRTVLVWMAGSPQFTNSPDE